ncbi:hypothetical protein NVP1101O_214 [Vibrio phage 1.101.O._10N.261.45.C6]|nr:hypothetical protein NVP1101O_214 [Vibrio phage 1.101.O._10N.261.45.C6]
MSNGKVNIYHAWKMFLLFENKTVKEVTSIIETFENFLHNNEPEKAQEFLDTLFEKENK